MDYEIFVIEQADDKPFNRGKLLNVGYNYALKSGCDYFVFHDVDMLPKNVDYSYSDIPLHLATNLQDEDFETIFFDYFGGVTMFTKEHFETINGFSNEYWGWGFEDDDLLVRCIKSNLDLDTESSSTLNEVDKFESFDFDGDNSFIKLQTKSKSSLLQDEFSISALVKPSQIEIDINKDYDEYPIVSIPGYNIGLFYNSFRRFYCQAYDDEKKPYSLTTDIVGEQWVHLTMTYSNDRKLSFYLNGTLVDSVNMKNDIMQLSTDEIYIGCASGKTFENQFFYGLISNIEIYDICLRESEVEEIYNQPYRIKLRNFGNFKSSEFLYTQIQPRLASTDEVIDVGGEYKGTLNNVGIKEHIQSFKSFIPKPHRRKSSFKVLEHPSNSSIGNKWVHQETRVNQLKFYNEVRKDFIDYKIDGLNTLRFKEVGTDTIGSTCTKISVEL